VVSAAGEHSVELGRFATDKEAEAFVAKLKEKGYESRSIPKAVKSEVTVVRIAGIADEAKLHELTGKLEKAKIQFVIQKH
jgi:cell division septation protein DedD